MKRILSVICALMLVTLILIPMSIVSAADSGMKIVVSDTTVSKGTETATVTLTLSGNTGTCGMLISIAYPEELTLLNAERGDALPDLTLATFYKPYINPLRMSLDGIDNDDTNGTLLTLTFDTSDAAEGEYPIKVTYRDGDIYDGNFAHLSPAITNGSVTIAKVGHTHTLTHHAAAKATCVNDGNVEYWSCSGCGKNFSDSDGANVLDDVRLAATGKHNFVWVIDTEATAGTVGIKHEECTVCHTKRNEGTEFSANAGVLEVGSVKANPGKEVKIPITLKKNPGIVSMTLEVTYDSDVFTLTGVNDTGLLAGSMHSDVYSSPYTLTWENDTSRVNFDVTGEIVELVFQVSDSAEVGTYKFDLKTPKDGIYNLNGTDIEFEMISGSCQISNYLLGDVNGDGEVTNKDRLMLSRYLAKWDGYGIDKLVFEAADINGDGEITNRDRLLLSRHLAKWDGYEDLYKFNSGGTK